MMNSKQRRALRVFAHEVELHIRNDEQYYKFDKRIKEARHWLLVSTERPNWTAMRTGYNYRMFKFRDAATATMFALKWS
jgi:hypothetical protein